MSEEQLKAAETEATAEVEEIVDEISEADLAGVVGGAGCIALPQESCSSNTVTI